jgi:hypothetical protein
MRSLVAVALLASALPAAATQVVAVSVEELARTSDAVVRAKVLEKKASKTADGKRIFTTIELRRSGVLRGDAPKRLRVVVPGGVVEGVGQRVEGAPEFEKGEDVVVFLQRAGPDAFRVASLSQGKFTVVGRTARPELSHLTFMQTSVRAGERRSEEMPLEELERRVRSTR